MAVVAWPPPTPPNTRTNTSPQLDSHVSDHNRTADALDTIIAAVNPRQGRGSIAQPFRMAGSVIFPGGTGANWATFYRLGDVVFVTATLWLQTGYVLPGATNAVLNLRLPWIPDPNVYKLSSGDVGGVHGRGGAFQMAGISTIQGSAVVALNQGTPTADVPLFTSYLAGSLIGWSAILRQHIDVAGAALAGMFHYVTANQGPPTP